MTSLPHTLKSAKAFYVFLEVGTREREFLEKHVRYRYTQASIPKRRGGTRTRFPDYGPGDELMQTSRQDNCKADQARSQIDRSISDAARRD
jgi:hypothetical protein